MKKSLIALAALAAVGTASAQSSVTLFGIVDATVQRVDNEGSGRVTRLHNSGYNSSRLGFRGTEDLGGGMSASFWLEAGIANDDGSGAPTNVNNQPLATLPTPAAGAALTASGVRPGQQGLTFNRRSTVSLAGGFGELRLGRDYTPQFWNLTIFDPFGTNGVGTTQALNGVAIPGVPAGTGIINPIPTTAAGAAANAGIPAAFYATQVRASNSIGYFLPANLGGFYGQVMYHLGENNRNGGATRDDGRGYGLRLGYAAGPLNVAVAMGRTDLLAVGDIRTINVGGQWDFGVAKLMAHFNRDRAGGGAAVARAEGDGWLVGGLVPVGAGEIRASYSQYELDPIAGLAAGEPRSRKLAVGYVHNLSKRTAVYTTYARVRNSGGAVSSVFPGALAGGAGFTAVNQSSNGLDLGVRHSF